MVLSNKYFERSPHLIVHRILEQAVGAEIKKKKSFPKE